MTLIRQFQHRRPWHALDWTDASDCNAQTELATELLSKQDTSNYARHFLRLLIHHLEDHGQFICPELLEYYCGLTLTRTTGTSSGGDLRRVYHFGNGRSLSLDASVNMIEQGNTGHSIWGASFYLAEFVLNRPDIFDGKHVLELGSGIGLVGLTCALTYSSSSVCLTDKDNHLVSRLRRSIDMNELQSNACAHVLNWSDSTTSSFKLPPLHDFDVVLAADCVYDDDITELFVQTLHRHVVAGASGKTKAFVACGLRHPETFKHFLDQFAVQGLRHELLDFTSHASFFYHDYVEQIQLLMIYK